MATTYATRAGTRKTSVSLGNSQDVTVAWGTVNLTTTPLLGDFIIMCKLPKGALVIGGRVTGSPLDSSGSGSALMSINVGIDKAVTAADGTAITAASTSNCLVSSLAIGPDAVAVTGYKATNTRNFPFGSLLTTNGPLLTSDECNVYVAVTASALAFTTGNLTIEVEYYASQTS